MPRESCSRIIKIVGVIAIIGFMLSSSAHAAPAPPDPTDFSQYLVAHQADLGPFLDHNSKDIIRQGVPLFLGWVGGVMLLTLVLGWGMDVFISRGFSSLFAPALTQWQRAIVYATGGLFLTVLLFILQGCSVIVLAGVPHLLAVLSAVFVIFILIGAAAQVAWIYILYRTDAFISILFYLFLVVIHGFTALIISFPMLGAKAGQPARNFVDQTITPRLQAEVTSSRQELAASAPADDQSATEAAQLQAQIDQDKSEEITVSQEIQDQKNSEQYLFSQIAKLHARGDLTAARDQFAALLARDANGPLTGLIRGQLTQVNNEIAAQQVQKQQAAAQTAQAAAEARADLLARAGRGQVTLSEMRRVLLGKSRADVSALFGPPTETASDRWGFRRQMILNPITNEHTGLAIYFFEGLVQSVDYYHGSPQ